MRNPWKKARKSPSLGKETAIIAACCNENQKGKYRPRWKGPHGKGIGGGKSFFLFNEKVEQGKALLKDWNERATQMRILRIVEEKTSTQEDSDLSNPKGAKFHFLKSHRAVGMSTRTGSGGVRKSLSNLEFKRVDTTNNQIVELLSTSGLQMV